jgi:O-antigen/teichoic acid export membrane protein
MKLRATSYLFSSSVMVNVAGLATGVMLARFLGPVARGELASFLFWPTFLAGIFGLSLNTAATFHSARLKGSHRMVAHKTLSTMILGTALTMAPLAYGILLLIDTSRFLSGMGFLALLYVASEIVRPSMHGLDAGRRDYVKLALFRLLMPLLYLMFLGTFGLLGSVSVETAVIAVILASIISATVQSLWPWRGIGIRDRFATEVLKTALRYHPSGVLNAIQNNLDRFIVVMFLPPSQIGVYFVASTFASAPYAASQQAIVSQLLSDFSSSRTAAETWYLLWKLLIYVFLVGVMLWLALALILPVAVPVLVGNGYEEVPGISAILALAFTFRMNMTVVNAYLQSIRASSWLNAFATSYIAGFMFAVFVVKPTTGIGIAYCLLAGFVANSVFAVLVMVKAKRSISTDFGSRDL